MNVIAGLFRNPLKQKGTHNPQDTFVHKAKALLNPVYLANLAKIVVEDNNLFILYYDK